MAESIRVDEVPVMRVVQSFTREPTTCHARAPRGGSISAASFLGYFGLVTFSTWYPPASVGVGIGTAGANGLIVASVTAGSDADHAGVQPGDRLVAINGRRLRSARDQRALSASVSVGEERTWLFERSGRQFSFTVAPPRRQVLPYLRFLPISVGLLASLVFSFVVIYSRPEDRVARLGALLLASIACATAPNWPRGLAATWRALSVLVGAPLWLACLSVLGQPLPAGSMGSPPRRDLLQVAQKLRKPSARSPVATDLG